MRTASTTRCTTLFVLAKMDLLVICAVATKPRSAEQEVIERSVILDKINKKVVVSLPWTKDPVEFLSRKHGGADNYAQAVKVYKSQCRKPDHMKEQMRKSHADLVRIHDSFA